MLRSKIQTRGWPCRNNPVLRATMDVIGIVVRKTARKYGSVVLSRKDLDIR